MSRLISSAQWARQPQIITDIDRAHPLAARLAFAYNGATVFDHAAGIPPQAPAGSAPMDGVPRTGERGKRQNGFSDAGYNLFYVQRGLASSSITLFVRFYVASTGTRFAFSFADEISDRGFEIGMNSTNLEVWMADSSTSWTATTGPTYSAGNVIDAALVIRAGQQAKLYTSKSGTVYTSAGNWTNDNSLTASEFVIGSYNVYNSSSLDGIVTCALAWERALSAAEIRSLMVNPWQVFAAQKRFPFPGILVTVQIAYPISDVSNSGWIASSGSDLYPMIGETDRNDATYIYATAVGALCEVQLTELGDPESSVNHLPTLVLSAPGGGGITVRLREGSTTRAEWTYYPSGTATEYQPTLTGTEINSITNYAALTYQIEAIA